MGRNIFATAADLQALTYYSNRQRVDVLACYLLDSKQYSMQEVAELVLGDDGSQAGQRVSLITRCYGFAARNAGRYARTAERKDIQDFVNKYQPERCGGLPEGTFDNFLQPRLEARQRRQQMEAARQQKLQDREEQCRIEEARRQQQLRQREEQQRQAELQYQQEIQRQLAEKQLQHEEYLRQQQMKKQQAEQIAEQAAGWWRKEKATLQDVANGIQLYQKALVISWEEFNSSFSITHRVYFSPSSEYFAVCARAAETAFRKKDYTAALTFCQYLCDYRPHGVRRNEPGVMIQGPNRMAIGKGYRIRVQIYFDLNGGYYDEQCGAEAARIGGAIFKEALCLLRYAECLEVGRGVKRDLWSASAAYLDLTKIPQFQAHANAKVDEIGQKLLEESSMEVADCLEKIAPDAFPMVGHDTKDWNAYQQTVLDLHALWEGYLKEHSKVSKTGFLFKKKQYRYYGRLSEEQFQQCCKYIWSQRRRQYEMADYKPCPGESVLTDQLFQQGMEQFRGQQFAEAASTLRLPASCGYLQAQKALVQIYGEHIRKPEVLRRMLELLAVSKDLSACEDLAKGYASLGDWENALNWVEKAGDLPDSEQWRNAIRCQAEHFALRIDEDRDTNTMALALRICQRLEVNEEKCSWLAWTLAKRQTDENQKIAYLKIAVDRFFGPACYDLACLEINRDGDADRIIALLEAADARACLPNRELLAEQFLKKQDFARAAEVYVQLEKVQDIQKCLSACRKARAQMPSAFSERSEEQHCLAYKIYHTILKYETGLKEKANVQYALSVAYENGYGTEQDAGKSFDMLKASAAGGFEAACYVIAQFYIRKGNYEAAQEELQKCTSDEPEYRQLMAEIARKLEERKEETSHIAAAVSDGRPDLNAPEATPSAPASKGEVPRPQMTENTFSETPTPEARSQSVGSRKGAKQVHLLKIDEELYDVSNATEAVTLTFSELLNEYPDRLEDCLRNISQLTRDSGKNNSVFRQKKLISTSAGDVWLGVSTGFEVKCAMVDRLCRVLELPVKKVIWYDGLEAVYMNSERG